MKLREVCSIQSGLTVKSGLFPDLENGTKVIRLQDVGTTGAIKVDTLRKVRLPVVSERYYLNAGDVVFRSRGNWTTAGYLPDDLTEAVVAVLPVVVLRPDRSIISPRFLAWELNKKRTQDHFRRIAHSSSVPLIPRTEIENLEVDIPNSDIQDIVADTAELIEESRRVQMELTDRETKLAEYKLSLCINSLESEYRENSQHG